MALALASVLSFVPTRVGALPPDFVAPPSSITGTVTDGDGVPVPNVIVASTDFGLFGFTDAEGQYVFEGLVAGTEYTMTAGDFQGTFVPGFSAPVVISDTAAVVADIVLQRIPKTGVTGTVVDEHGVPLAGIEVRDAVDFNAPTVVTGADGTFRLTGLQLGQFHLFTAFDPSGQYQSASTDFIQIADDGSTVVDFTLIAAPFNVTGVVLDELGAPLEGVGVSSGFFGSVVRTRADGRFFLQLPAGPATLTVSDPSDRYRAQEVAVDVPEATTLDLTISLQPMPTIEVTVLADGRPVAGAPIDATFGFFRVSRTTGPDGTARLPIETLGDYTLLVSPNDIDHVAEYYPDSITAEGATPVVVTEGSHVLVTVTLERAAVVEGTVRGPDGAPVDADVTARGAGLAPGIFSLTACNLRGPTDPAGSYRVGCLRPGQPYVLQANTFNRFDVQFFDTAISPARATPLTLVEGETRAGVDFHLRPRTPDPTVYGLSRSYFLAGTTTRGVHLYGSEFPLDETALDTFVETEFNGPDTTMHVTKVLGAGEALVDVTVAPSSGGGLYGRSIVLNRSTGGVALCASCFLVGDRTTPVGSAAGKVTDSNDRPVAGIQVMFRSSTFGTLSVVTGSDGKYSISGLRPGSYTVQFAGNERWGSARYKASQKEPLGRPVVIAAGKSVNGVNGELRRRGPITFTGVTPSTTGIAVEVDAIGTGLDPIRGGFRVSAIGPAGAFPANMSYTATGALRISTFAQPDVYDVRLEWTKDDGTTGSIVCAGCLRVTEPLQLSPFFGGPFTPGSVGNSVFFSGEGIHDIVGVTGDDGISVTGFDFFFGFFHVTFDVAADARVGDHAFTVTRADGVSAPAPFAVTSPDVPV